MIEDAVDRYNIHVDYRYNMLYLNRVVGEGLGNGQRGITDG